MEINYNTKKLVILNYQAGGGGKFISLCLALDKNVLHQDRYLAKKKMERIVDSFAINKVILQKSTKKNNHFELGCFQLAGFNANDNMKQQEIKANDLWKKLTNQDKYYFVMVDNGSNRWGHYPNANHIILRNYDFILKGRNINLEKPISFEQLDCKKKISFDCESIKNKTSFKNEIFRLFDFLLLDEPCLDHIEEFRYYFLKTFKIGFITNKNIQ